MHLNELVISTRLSLKRNLANYNFALSLSEKKSEEIYLHLKNVIEQIHFSLGDDFVFEVQELSKLDFLELKKLQAEGIISPKMQKEEGGVVRGIARCKKCYILINVDDHITIGAIVGIDEFAERYNVLYAVETVLGKYVPYAFDEQFGFLTSAIDYFGSGFSVAFLSSIYFIVRGEKYLKKFMETLSPMLSLFSIDTGQANEKSKFLFQIATLHAHCETPEHQLRDIFSVLNSLVELESTNRKNFLTQQYDEAYDFVLRAFLLAKNSLIIAEYELYDLLAALRFGIYAKIIRGLQLEIIDELVVKLHTPFLVQRILDESKISMQDITIKMVDKKRASILNDILTAAEIKDYTEGYKDDTNLLEKFSIAERRCKLTAAMPVQLSRSMFSLRCWKKI